MADTSLDKFGEIVVKDFYDVAIDHFELLVKGHFIASMFKSLQSRIALLDDQQRQLVRDCLRSAVDTGIDAFFGALVDPEHGIVINGHDFSKEAETASEDEYVSLNTKMWAKDGWLSQFSKFSVRQA